jgi:hypothetical protein
MVSAIIWRISIIHHGKTLGLEQIEMNKIILNGSGVKITTDRFVKEHNRGESIDSGNEEDDVDPFMFWPNRGEPFLLYGQIVGGGTRHFTPLK